MKKCYNNFFQSNFMRTPFFVSVPFKYTVVQDYLAVYSSTSFSLYRFVLYKKMPHFHASVSHVYILEKKDADPRFECMLVL